MATVMHGEILLSTIFLISSAVEATASNDNTVETDYNKTTDSYNNYNTSGADWNSTTDSDITTRTDYGLTYSVSYDARPSFEPSTGVVVGEVATLKCDFQYERWNRYKVNETIKFSLFLSRVNKTSTWSDPDSEWPETNYAWSMSIQLKPGYDYGNYTQIHNRTIESIDKETYLLCRIISPLSSLLASKPLPFRKISVPIANGSVIPKSSSVLLFLYFGLMLIIVG